MGSLETHWATSLSDFSDSSIELSLGVIGLVNEDFSERGFEKNALRDQKTLVNTITNGFMWKSLRYGSLGHFSFRLKVKTPILIG